MTTATAPVTCSNKKFDPDGPPLTKKSTRMDVPNIFSKVFYLSRMAPPNTFSKVFYLSRMALPNTFSKVFYLSRMALTNTFSKVFSSFPIQFN